MIEKVLSFITDGEKFLALRNNSKDPKHGGDFWFVVTGSIEQGETPEDAVKREIKEETGLNVKKVLNLRWGSVYGGWQGECKESNFFSFIEKDSIINLDMKEVVEYKWLNLEDFVELIKWNENKELLKKILLFALEGKAYFSDVKGC